jgi:hypothetical protein
MAPLSPPSQDWLAWTIRALKLIALLGFALPWFAVSCAGKPFVEARGYELAFGLKIEASEDFTLRQQAQDAEGAARLQPAAYAPPASAMAARPGRPAPPAVQFLAAGAAIFLLLGLAFGFLLRGEGFGAVSALAGFAAAGLAWASYAGVEMELRRQLAEVAASPLGALAAAQLDIVMQPLIGLVVTVGAGILAGLLGGISLFLALRARPAAPTASTGG